MILILFSLTRSLLLLLVLCDLLPMDGTSMPDERSSVDLPSHTQSWAFIVGSCDRGLAPPVPPLPPSFAPFMLPMKDLAVKRTYKLYTVSRENLIHK